MKGLKKADLVKHGTSLEFVDSRLLRFPVEVLLNGKSIGWSSRTSIRAYKIWRYILFATMARSNIKKGGTN